MDTLGLYSGTTFPGVASSNPVAPGDRVIDRRHPEWKLHQLRWRFLLDSWEGGETYRQAIYGWDLQGMPIRNMIRHPHEYPDSRAANNFGVLGRPPGSDQYAQATNDPFELRRARTPVPSMFRRTILTHLAKVFAEDADRSGPPDVAAWWEDVNGSRSSMRDWMRHTVGPLGLAFGQLDVICDFAPLPRGVKRSDVRSQADVRDLGIDRVIANYILPENLCWWQLDERGRYEELLITEPQDSGELRYRHWTPREWLLYDQRGEVIDRDRHRFGRPPVVRLFDQRRPRARNVGLPRYEDIAEIMREVYNRASELILSDTHQAHAIIQAAEDYCQAGADIPMGPNNVLPKKKVESGSEIRYEPWEVLAFPKEGIDSLRTNILDLKADADQCGHLTRPAGAAAGDGKTVATSGISKRLDTDTGNTALGDVAETIARWDREITELYLFVAGRGEVDPAKLESVSIMYPKDFDLFSPEETAGLIGDYQQSLQGTGATPTADTQMLTDLYRKSVKGKPDDHYTQVEAEIEAHVARQSKLHSANHEASLAQAQATQAVGENTAGTESAPDQANVASLAAAGAVLTGVY